MVADASFFIIKLIYCYEEEYKLMLSNRLFINIESNSGRMKSQSGRLEWCKSIALNVFIMCNDFYLDCLSLSSRVLYPRGKFHRSEIRRGILGQVRPGFLKLIGTFRYCGIFTDSKLYPNLSDDWEQSGDKTYR